MTGCISVLGTCSCICGQLVSNITTPLLAPSPPLRLGNQFTPGPAEISIEDTKDAIPFQDLSKLAKRQDWAVVKLTNVIPQHCTDADSMGLNN
jgi:hypothetical protein